MEKLDVDEDIAEALASEGFTNLEEVAYVPAEEMANIGGFDAEIVEELQRRASDLLLMQEIADQEEMVDMKPADDLLGLEGMNQKLAYQLAKHGVVTREDLADQSVGELCEIVDIDNDFAAKLIMKAREHWFEEADK